MTTPVRRGACRTCETQQPLTRAGRVGAHAGLDGAACQGSGETPAGESAEPPAKRLARESAARHAARGQDGIRFAIETGSGGGDTSDHLTIEVRPLGPVEVGGKTDPTNVSCPSLNDCNAHLRYSALLGAMYCPSCGEGFMDVTTPERRLEMLTGRRVRVTMVAKGKKPVEGRLVRVYVAPAGTMLEIDAGKVRGGIQTLDVVAFAATSKVELAPVRAGKAASR